MHNQRRLNLFLKFFISNKIPTFVTKNQYQDQAINKTIQHTITPGKNPADTIVQHAKLG